MVVKMFSDSERRIEGVRVTNYQFIKLIDTINNSLLFLCIILQIIRLAFFLLHGSIVLLKSHLGVRTLFASLDVGGLKITQCTF